MKGIVFNIQKFCVNDGPGIRTTVFLKGCPLRCLWCHNPESYSAQPQLSYEDSKCIRCARCVQACPKNCHSIGNDGTHVIDRSRCIGCGRCVQSCPVTALRITGEWMSAENVMEKVLQDRIFYETSGGGITISGGEPFFQPDFTAELLRLAAQENIHTCVETSGYVDYKNILKSLPYIDLMLWDIKEMDPDRHRQYTGGSLDIVLENLDRVCAAGLPVILRCPVVPEMNDRRENEHAIELLANKYRNILGVQKMPYHNLGIHKSAAHGMEKQMDYSKKQSQVYSLEEDKNDL